MRAYASIDREVRTRTKNISIHRRDMSKAAVTETLAQWMRDTRYDDLPSAVKEKTVDVIYDSVGCMVACSKLSEIKTVVDFVEAQGGEPECSIIGSAKRVPAVNAAMA